MQGLPDFVLAFSRHFNPVLAPGLKRVEFAG
jgi:hypothetical protein